MSETITGSSMLIILNKKQEAVGILDNNVPQACPYFNDVHTENIESNLSTFQFEIIGGHPSASLLQVEGFVIYSDYDNKQHLFSIKEIVDSRNETLIKRIYCEHTAVDELIVNIVRPIQMKSYSIQQAIDIALAKY